MVETVQFDYVGAVLLWDKAEREAGQYDVDTRAGRTGMCDMHFRREVISGEADLEELHKTMGFYIEFGRSAMIAGKPTPEKPVHGW